MVIAPDPVELLPNTFELLPILEVVSVTWNENSIEPLRLPRTAVHLSFRVTQDCGDSFTDAQYREQRCKLLHLRTPGHLSLRPGFSHREACEKLLRARDVTFSLRAGENGKIRRTSKLSKRIDDRPKQHPG